MQILFQRHDKSLRKNSKLAASLRLILLHQIWRKWKESMEERESVRED